VALKGKFIILPIFCHHIQRSSSECFLSPAEVGDDHILCPEISTCSFWWRLILNYWSNSVTDQSTFRSFAHKSGSSWRYHVKTKPS